MGGVLTPPPQTPPRYATACMYTSRKQIRVVTKDGYWPNGVATFGNMQNGMALHPAPEASKIT